MFDLLIKMTPSRKRRKPGEVFVIQPFENVYFYGRVMRTKIVSSNNILNGWNLVYIYKTPFEGFHVPTEPLRPDDLMIAPIVVNNQGWLQGYFETVGVTSVSDEDFATHTGFLVYPTSDVFVDVEGNRLDFIPELWSPHALGAYSAVGIEVHRYLKQK